MARVEDRPEKLVGVYLDTATVEVTRMHIDLGKADDAVVGVDDDRLRSRRALVDGQHRHGVKPLTAQAVARSGLRVDAVPEFDDRTEDLLGNAQPAEVTLPGQREQLGVGESR